MRLSKIVNIGKIGWVVGGGKIARNVSTRVEYRSVCMHKYCSLKANVPITKTHTHCNHKSRSHLYVFMYINTHLGLQVQM